MQPFVLHLIEFSQLGIAPLPSILKVLKICAHRAFPCLVKYNSHACVFLFLIFVLSICKSYEDEMFSVGGRVGAVCSLSESGV